MIIGYAVQRTTDRAFLKGLRERWCPQAEMKEGRFRGGTGLALRREIPQICKQLRKANADVMVFLTDADVHDWREVKRRESGLVPAGYQDIIVYGVADRNIECWLASDRGDLASGLNINPADLNVPDPKDVFEYGIGITSSDKKEPEIVAIVRDAPVRNWIQNSKSFESFYDDVRDMSQRLGCNIPNEREKP
jgi:hypothetical protein